MIKLIGKVLHITPSKLLVVKISDPSNIPVLGSMVVRSRGEEPLGKVIDVIGPITSPYAVVKLLREGIKVEPGIELFYIVPRRKRKVTKRRR